MLDRKFLMGTTVIAGLAAAKAVGLAVKINTVALRQGQVPRTVVVRCLSAQRGPAPVAQLLYEETAESIAAREKAQELRRLAPEPASTLQEGRPTKRDRRNIDRAHDWGDRWSASADDDA